MTFKRALNLPPEPVSFFLLGPRGVGKTRLLKEGIKAKKDFIYINLLINSELKRYRENPTLINLELTHLLEHSTSNQSSIFVVIDEVQKLPELLDEVHDLIERYPEKLQFALSGSSARKLKRSGSNLLAGRAESLKLHPFTSSEIEPFDLLYAMQFGTLPKAYIEKNRKVAFLNSYVETYLKEEIQLESAVRNLEAFERFLEVAAQMNGQLINFSKISKDCHVSPKTVTQYYSILTDTLLTFRLDPFSRSVREQIRQQPKFYFFDNGILNALRGDLQTLLKESSYRFGSLFESLVIQEFHRYRDYFNPSLKFYHWRTEDDKEVDLIVDRGFSQIECAVEIKSSVSPSLSDLKGLLAYGEYHSEAELICLCRTPRTYQLNSRVKVLPWYDGLKSTVGIAKNL